MIKTIAKNRTKYIADAFAEFTQVTMYDSSTGNNIPSTVDYALKALHDGATGAKLWENRDGDTVTKYTVHVHSNRWYTLTKPAPAAEPEQQPATETPAAIAAEHESSELAADAAPLDRRAAEYNETAAYLESLTPEQIAEIGADPATIARFAENARAAATNPERFELEARDPRDDSDVITDWWTVCTPEGRELARVWCPDAEKMPETVRRAATQHRLLRLAQKHGARITWRRLRYSVLTDAQKHQHDAAQRELPAAAGVGKHHQGTQDFFAQQPRGYGPVQISYMVCATCGHHGPLSTDQRHGAIADDWGTDHTRDTGHGDFDLWTLSRSQARTTVA